MRRRASALLLATGVLLASCSDDAPGGDTADDGGSAVIVTTTTTSTTTTSTTPTSTTEPVSVDTEPAAAPTTASTSTTTATTTTTTTVPVVGNPVVATVEVARLDQPVDLAVRPGDDGLYLVEQRGRVVRVDPASGEQAVMADISDRTGSSGERGLLGAAFSPDGALGYLDYSGDGGDTVIAEYPVGADGTFDVTAERIVLTVDQPYGNHNAGDLEFGPDGFLYVTLGDGGSGGDPERRASDPTQLLGSLLRIDPTPAGDAGYTVPADNPFADGEHGGVAGAPEVWSYGLRNPWKIAFDPVTGELWIADVGQNRIEEIDVVGPTADHPAGWGANFGWSAYEGTDRFNADVPDPGDLVFPVLTYEHGDDGCSISGGVPYRGTAIPELAPAYVYSDYCSGKLWALDLAGGRNLTLLTGLGPVTAVRTGPDGEIYVVSHDGILRRLVPA